MNFNLILQGKKTYNTAVDITYVYHLTVAGTLKVSIVDNAICKAYFVEDELIGAAESLPISTVILQGTSRNQKKDCKERA